jgi:hypothetical protein
VIVAGRPGVAGEKSDGRRPEWRRRASVDAVREERGNRMIDGVPSFLEVLEKKKKKKKKKNNGNSRRTHVRKNDKKDN